MTRQTLNNLIKKASRKNKAVDRAMEAAAKLGKPTTSGLVAGAGLGSILAAAGALSREGVPASETSVFSNPLLLGALGASGGYLAGNAFENAPATPNRKNNLSPSALALLTGGVGAIGSNIAADDIASALDLSEERYDKAFRQIPSSIRNALHNMNENDIKKVDLNNVNDADLRRALRNRNASPQAIRGDYKRARKAYARALREAGRLEDAAFLGENFYLDGNRAPNKLGWRLLDKIRFSKYSPVRWSKALNPLKGRKLLEQLGGMAVKNKKTTALAALALLAGGGKAIYDKTR